MSKDLVYTGGSFDVFHAGHVDLLRRCSKFGLVVVALNTDEFITRFKHKPTQTYEERRDVLEACKYVYKVITNESGEDSKPTILKVNPRYLVIGSDWLRKDYMKQMQFTPEWLEAHDITLVYVPRVRPLSSTMIKERIK
jgi:glycerol-3-phosphate cytidylyltransferase